MTASSSAQPPGSGRQLAAFLLLFLWLEAGYVPLLRLTAQLSWPSALWQAAVCVLASPLLLLFVVNILSWAKDIRGLPRLLGPVFWVLLDLSQFALPWLGWSALLVSMNFTRLSWPDALGAAAAIAAFSYLNGLAIILIFRPKARDVQVTHHEVTVPNLPRPFHGYRILHLSDIHGGGWLPPPAIRARLRPAASLAPDIIIFTGDLGASARGNVESIAQLLGGLPSKQGIVGVLGNHDQWTGEERVVNALSAAGVRVLRNSHLAIARDGATLYLAGVKDASYTGSDDLPAALEGIPDDAPVLLLSHTPGIVDQPLSARAFLVLSGHTHGGQVVLPHIGPIHVPSRVERRLASGLHQMDGRWLFVNRGLGEIFPPIRLNCPPEMALLTLRSTLSSD
ncbi:MAG: metallophosphoesterase [Armatimonadota bacterium]|nr:MAG: metallophosphoesterase [Armatimonadota bacterium]